MSAATSFYLLQPERLPAHRGELASGGLAAVLNDMAGLHQRPDSVALEAARKALHQLGLGPDRFTPVRDDPNESQGNKANDLAFRIVRVQGDVMPLLVHSALQGFVALLDEAVTGGSDLDSEQWGRLRAAFTAMFSILAGQGGEPPPVGDMEPTRLTAGSERDALVRWTRGHHVFMVLVQGLVVSLNRFRKDLASGDVAGAASALKTATVLMGGSEAALRFTGDYSYSAYEKSVRPTLMPPVAPPGMSGLRWRDHEHMVALLTEMRPVFAQLQEPVLREQRDAFHAAIAHAYDAHKLVCGSFVGHETTSLLSKKSAVEVLDNFKKGRLLLVKE